MILNIVLGIITVFVSFYGLIQNNQNTELKQKIEQDNIKMDELYTKIILLNDSINQLNTIKKNN
ncbi:MAG: hypothetical protein A2X13_10605 [Bacteroidetes bacterium GWC2_33_15]|nr:MAG: hypothetical protein A2X10_03155 [Bacteroidetes bacterium GWA2_33_15]OFX48848.1 MAG: hypothetical protein A2X13_10605 [Bacteroidetes bacterium GWC2_33_15]OFX66091.1 MAG: hypothetical protein A2X15_11750 [Bacteroidetes bacterium GWB2_32_14]OFX68147.1 MAG: hypothetical protein A2X14_07145 [Bacteroidetes bacterium GWD2_33_33]HAN17919.1 hypothetical protein [Bacteroidales bacterium]